MRRAAKIDTTAKALRAYAEETGFVVAHIGGVIDCLLIWGTTVTAVDWKSKGGTLTPDQVKWVAKGVPIRFITTPEQIQALKDEVRGRAA